MSFFLKYWSPIVATISLAISVYVLYKNRSYVDAEFSPNITEIPLDSIYLKKDGMDKAFLNFSYLTRLTIVNPSPNDISFFALRAFNTKTNRNLFLLTNRSMPFGYENSTAINKVTNKLKTRLLIPNSNSGVIPAHGIVKLDLVIVLDPNTNEDHNLDNLDNISVDFKIAKFVLTNRDPFSNGIFHKYRYKGMHYDVSGWQSRRKQQTQTLLKQSEHEKQTSKSKLLVLNKLKSFFDSFAN